MSSYAFERNESCFCEEGFFIHIYCCTMVICVVQITYIISDFFVYFVSYWQCNIKGCNSLWVCFFFKYVALSFIWIYVIACMHIHIVSIFYNFNSSLWKGLNMSGTIGFFLLSVLFQISVEPLQLFYVWCLHEIIFFSF